MRYFVTLGSGEGSYDREIEFEERKEGLFVKVYKRASEEEDALLENEYPMDAASLEHGKVLNLLVNGKSHDIAVMPRKGGFDLTLHGELVSANVVDERERLAQSVAGAGASGPKTVNASMPGIVVSLDCELGQEVAAGDTLLILEAMKMQNPIASETDGKVDKIHVEPGQAVNAGDALISLT